MEVDANILYFADVAHFSLHVVDIDGMFCHGGRMLFGGVSHASVKVPIMEAGYNSSSNHQFMACHISLEKSSQID